MRPLHFKILLAFAVALQQLGYFLFWLKVEGSWYLCNAGTHVVLWSALALSHLRSNTFIKQDDWSKRWLMYGVLAASNQLVDEVWGVATRTQINEVIVFSFIIMHLIYYIYRDTRRQ